MAAQRNDNKAAKPQSGLVASPAGAAAKPSKAEEYVLVRRELADEGGAAAYTQLDTDTKQPVLAAPSAQRVRAILSGKGRKGLKPIRVVIPVSYTFLGATSGASSSAQTVVPDTNTTEWSAFQALYDEYKVHGGTYKFFVPNSAPTPTGSGGLGTNEMLVMGYDPVDSTALTSVVNGCELSQHLLIAPSFVGFAQATGTTTAGGELFGYAAVGGKPFEFKWRTSPVQALSIQSGAISQSPGSWKAIQASGSNSPDGSLKMYSVLAASTGTRTAVCGVLYLDVEFRSRK
jgi:hypothetical protein